MSQPTARKVASVTGGARGIGRAIVLDLFRYHVVMLTCSTKIPGAVVVRISSVNAVLHPAGAALHGARKAALELWTLAMAKVLGSSGIPITAVAPGAVNTPEAPCDPDFTGKFDGMTAMGRLVSPKDIAAAARFLAKDAPRAIAGEVPTVSGGYRL